MQDDFFASSFHLNYHTRNAIVVRPGTDLAVVYDWIKSAQRDGAMGALAADNWRVILLTPGVHTVAATLILDTDYVSLVGMSGNREDTRVEGNFAGAVIEQTANVIALRGFTVYQADLTPGTPGINAAIGFLINVSVGDNEGSIYHSMYFDSANHTDGLATIAVPVYCNTTEKGTWWFCEGTVDSWRIPENGTFSPTMYFCKGADSSYGGDGGNTGNGSIGGTYHNCKGGDYCWGGCGWLGLEILNSAKFYDCIAGNRSYAMGRACAGTFYRCKGGANCFGGWDGASVYYGTFSGKAHYCEATGNSFGGGDSNCSNTGKMRFCDLTSGGCIWPTSAEFYHCILSALAGQDCINLDNDHAVLKSSFAHCRFGCSAGNYSITAAGAKTASIYFCRISQGLNNVTSTYDPAYNVVAL